MDFGKIIKGPTSVKRIFKKNPGVDGFSVELEDGKIAEISYTAWNTSDNKKINSDTVIFSTNNGDIVFSLEQAKGVDFL